MLEESGLLETVSDGNNSIALDRQPEPEFSARANHPKEVITCINEYTKLNSKWANQRTGIIRYLTTEPPDPANFKFVWTGAASLRHSASAQESLKTTGFGVGVSAVEATTKAVAEALELHAAGKCSDENLLYSSLAELSGDFLDPRACSLYDGAQYRKSDFSFERFHTRSRIAWTRGQWLDTSTEVWLPAFLTYFGAAPSLNQRFAQVTTSGLATGTGLEEATMHAVCELIERDAFMITWLAQVPARRVVPDCVDDLTSLILNEFESRGLEMRLYLLSVGLDVPVVLCLIRGDGKNWPGATVGLGAHASHVIATRQAILEQALMGPALRREMLAGQRRIPERASQVRTTLDHALYYVPKRRARAFDFLDAEKRDPVLLSELVQPETITLDLYREKLQASGIRMAIKDLTPPEIATESAFRIVRALGNRLQPLHFGFGLTRASTQRLKRLVQRNGLNSNPHPLA